MNPTSAAISIILLIIVIFIVGGLSRQDGFADNVGAPIGAFSTGGGIYMDDVPQQQPGDTIWGGKSGRNEFVGGCCSGNNVGGCNKCALSVNQGGSAANSAHIADNSSVLNYDEFGAEPATMANAIGNDRAYLSPTPYMPSGTNLVPAGDPYTPPYSEYMPPIY